MVFIKIPKDMKHLLCKHHLNFLLSNDQKLNTCFDQFGTVQRPKPRLLKHKDDIMMKVVLSRISMQARKEYIFYIIHLGVFAKERSSYPNSRENCSAGHSQGNISLANKR